jgi:hypothetical protein
MASGFVGPRLAQDGADVVARCSIEDRLFITKVFSGTNELERATREHRIAALVREGGRVRLLVRAGKPVLAQPDFDGVTLLSLLSAGAPLDIGTVLKLSVSLAEEVARFHAVGVACGAVNPASILCNIEHGTALLFDYSNARSSHELVRCVRYRGFVTSPASAVDADGGGARGR